MYHNADDLDLVEIVAAMRARMRQSQRRIAQERLRPARDCAANLAERAATREVSRQDIVAAARRIVRDVDGALAQLEGAPDTR